jgi:hypothetical protein
MIVELEGMAVILHNISGEFVFGVVAKQAELAAARVLIKEVYKQLDAQLRVIIDASES